MKRPNILITLGVVLLAVTLPYILAVLIAGQAHVFVGFLLNPPDGASYLAKMYQGWSGAWRFTLPYTADPGQGAYLFLFYLFLGHLARWLGLPLIWAFHLARLISAGLLLFALLHFFDRLFCDRPDLYRIAFWLTAIGSGMGWLILFLGPTPTDFWVAEAYPFLAMFSNPHFPAGLALLVGSFTLLMESGAQFRAARLLLAGLLISIILPFALAVALLVAAAWLIWTWLETRRFEWLPVFCLGVLGGPFLLYQFWVAQVDPVLAGWNAQNITPSPPIWDFLCSFSPALLLAPFGAFALWKMKQNAGRRIIIAWFVLGLLLVYFPFPLQRRFMLGFFIPSAVLAVFGLDFLRQRFTRIARWLVPATFALALPTNVLLLAITLFGALGHAPVLYMTRDEARALDWIQAETPLRALILASPEMGAWIPAFTGRRVIYGHPFETVQAGREKAQVSAFYSSGGKVTAGNNFLSTRHPDYVMYGPRERALGSGLDLSAFPLVYAVGTVWIYAVPKASQ
jgi:hypothetical protein